MAPITIGEKYIKPIRSLKTAAEALNWYITCVADSMQRGLSLEEAKAIENANIGYCLGYFDAKTHRRIEGLLQEAGIQAFHPLFGSADVYRKGEMT